MAVWLWFDATQILSTELLEESYVFFSFRVVTVKVLILVLLGVIPQFPVTIANGGNFNISSLNLNFLTCNSFCIIP